MEEYVEFVKTTLGDDIKNSGTILYSSGHTLRRGKYLIVGLNPGGEDPDNKDSIYKSINNIYNKDWNGYYEDWNDGGKHRLQENLKCIAKVLNFDLKDTCATNLILKRTRSASQIDRTDYPKYESIFGKVLEIVSPEIIITFGVEPSQRIYKYFNTQGFKPTIIEKEPSGHGNWQIRHFHSTYKNNIKVIGFPHLSRYTIYNREEVLQWLKKNYN